MARYNSCNMELDGRIGKIEKKETRNGKTIAVLSVAYNTSNKKDDPYRKTVWFDCVAFGDAAEDVLARHKKGDVIHIKRASPDLDEWDDRGTKRSRTKWIIWETGEAEDTLAGGGSSDPEAPFGPGDDDIPY